MTTGYRFYFFVRLHFMNVLPGRLRYRVPDIIRINTQSIPERPVLSRVLILFRIWGRMPSGW